MQSLIVDNVKHADNAGLTGNPASAGYPPGPFRSGTHIMSIGHRIQSLRRKSGLSQSLLGDRIGVKQNTISSWEQDRTRPGPDAVRALARILSASPAWIEFGMSGDTPNEERVRVRAGGQQRVPLISWVQAGELADIEDPYPKGSGARILDISWSHGDLIALSVTGESMNRISPDGSVIIVDLRDREPRTGRQYVIKIDGQSTYKTYRDAPKRLEPESTEPFDVIPLGHKDYIVVGRVIRTQLDLI